MGGVAKPGRGLLNRHQYYKVDVLVEKASLDWPFFLAALSGCGSTTLPSLRVQESTEDLFPMNREASAKRSPETFSSMSTLALKEGVKRWFVGSSTKQSRRSRTQQELRER